MSKELPTMSKCNRWSDCVLMPNGTRGTREGSDGRPNTPWLDVQRAAVRALCSEVTARSVGRRDPDVLALQDWRRCWRLGRGC